MRKRVTMTNQELMKGRLEKRNGNSHSFHAETSKQKRTGSLALLLGLDRGDRSEYIRPLVDALTHVPDREVDGESTEGSLSSIFPSGKP
ncbi:hypothetical protein GW17_00032206 [Ensete ventricosum]|nr:hypothetical protein GW17_00032206 [Ensete ventricosum]